MSMLSIAVPDGIDKETALRVAERALGEAAAVGAVEKVLADTKTPPGPGAMAQAALREENWRRIETTWGLLDANAVVALVGAKPGSGRTTTANLRRRKRLLGVKRHGALRYPAFQFVEHKDKHVVAPAWTEMVECLDAARWSDANLLIWAAAPNAYLDGRSPAIEVQDEPAHISAALHYAIDRAIPESRKREAHHG